MCAYVCKYIYEWGRFNTQFSGLLSLSWLSKWKVYKSIYHWKTSKFKPYYNKSFQNNLMTSQFPRNFPNAWFFSKKNINFFTLELIIWLHSSRKHFKLPKNEHQYIPNWNWEDWINLLSSLIKPKHAQHLKIPIFAKVHVLFVENVYATISKSKTNIWKYISVKRL